MTYFQRFSTKQYAQHFPAIHILLHATYTVIKLDNMIYIYHSKHYSNFYNSAPKRYQSILWELVNKCLILLNFRSKHLFLLQLCFLFCALKVSDILLGTSAYSTLQCGSISDFGQKVPLYFQEKYLSDISYTMSLKNHYECRVINKCISITLLQFYQVSFFSSTDYSQAKILNYL